MLRQRSNFRRNSAVSRSVVRLAHVVPNRGAGRHPSLRMPHRSFGIELRRRFAAEFWALTEHRPPALQPSSPPALQPSSPPALPVRGSVSSCEAVTDSRGFALFAGKNPFAFPHFGILPIKSCGRRFPNLHPLINPPLVERGGANKAPRRDATGLMQQFRDEDQPAAVSLSVSSFEWTTTKPSLSPSF